jgi:hypothetical protein
MRAEIFDVKDSEKRRIILTAIKNANDVQKLKRQNATEPNKGEDVFDMDFTDSNMSKEEAGLILDQLIAEGYVSIDPFQKSCGGDKYHNTKLTKKGETYLKKLQDNNGE